MILSAINRIEQLGTIENVALNYHVPCDATYIVVDNNLNYKIISRKRFSFNSKYVAMDFYSRITDINKAVDRKKLITSNNYLTFFYKKKNVKRLLDSDTINNYYNNLETPDDKLLYRNWIKENISKFSGATSNGLIKIFFTRDLGEYISLGNKYLKENILSNKVNKREYGTSIFINLNAKKPYLKNHTRKQSIPELIYIEQAIKYKYFADILMSLVLKGYDIVYILEDGRIIPVNSKGDIPEIKFINGIFIAYRLNNRGKLILLDMDVVPKYSSSF